MKNKSLEDKLREVILLTSYEDRDGTVWGHDTDCGMMEDLVERAKEIMKGDRK